MEKKQLTKLLGFVKSLCLGHKVKITNTLYMLTDDGNLCMVGYSFKEGKIVESHAKVDSSFQTLIGLSKFISNEDYAAFKGV